MRKKKYKSVLLGILLVLVLVGCGNTKETGKPEESEMTVETAAEEEAIEIQGQTQGTQEEVTNIDTEGLKEFVSEDETISAVESAKEPDTIAWFNAAGAVLTYLNGWDYQIYGGMPEGKTTALISQQLLDGYWGVTDRETAENNMKWLLSSGHNAALLEDLAYFESEGLGEVAAQKRAAFLYENWDISEEMASLYAKCYERYEAGEDDIIIGWDYSRAFNLLSWYYLAGYYSKEEALDISLVAGWEIQEHFDSWDEFMESYFLGYEYWSEESSGERRLVYKKLKDMEDGPYTINWNLNLKKSW